MTEKVERLMALRGDRYQWFIITSKMAKCRYSQNNRAFINEKLFCGMLYSVAETG